VSLLLLWRPQAGRQQPQYRPRRGTGWVARSVGTAGAPPGPPPAIGGGDWPAPNAWQIQYQDYAAPLRPPFPNVTGAAIPAFPQVFPGPTVQYDSYVSPLVVPTVGPPTVPDGVAVWAAGFPLYRLRRAVLPETGGTFMPTFTPQVSASALSWVPVYERRGAAFAPKQQFATDPSIWNVPTTAGAPPITATLPRYPDRLLRPAQPNVAAGLTWVPISIVPAPPPVQHLRTDLRRRQMLTVRRLIR